MTNAVADDDADSSRDGGSVGDEIEWLASILLNPTLEQSVRRGAAERLLGMRRSAASAPLKEALRSKDAAMMLAVIEAMQSASAVDGALVSVAAEALRDVPDEALDQLSAMLAKHSDESLKHVKGLASNEQLSDDERLGAIHALGVVRSRDAAVQLMALIDAADRESETVIEAACRALQRATGLLYGNNPLAWQQWWTEARNQPREQWLTDLVQRLSDQLGDAEQQILEERQRSRQLEQRLAELYRDLFPRFTEEEQLAILPGLLDDPLPAIRGSALDRIARLLRDSVRIPDDVQRRMAERLDDEEPAIRLQSIRLLDQLNDDRTPARLARRLEIENERAVVSALLEFLARRPAPGAADAVIVWLNDPREGGRAAAALWAYAANNVSNDDQEKIETLGERVLQALDEMENWTRSPAHVRLFCRFVSRDETDAINALLAAEPRAIRRAAAEGLIARDWSEPILDRADDPVMQPFILRVLAEQEPTISSLRLLAMLEIEDGLIEQWESAVRSLARAFPADQLLEVDALLGRAPSASRQLRAEVLSRIESVNEDSIDADRRDAILTRLAVVRLQLDQAEQALAAMQRVNGDSLVSEARQVKFEAAVRSRRFDLAASLSNDVDVWIALLDQLIERDLPIAAALHEEIRERFHSELVGERKAQLDALAERLDVAAGTTRADDESPA